jgi:hypothetical protein
MPEKPEQGSAVTQNSILSTIAINQFKVARKKIRTLVEVGNTGVGAAEETVEERHGSNAETRYVEVRARHAELLPELQPRPQLLRPATTACSW